VKFLKRHPFATVAFFDRVVAVSFAFPEAALRPLLAPALELDTYEGFGFVTVSMVWTSKLRPAAFPAFAGQDFFLAGYRLFTRLREPSGRRLRGLQILRSETDQRRMVWLGNLFTPYQYRQVRVCIAEENSATRVQTLLPDGRPTLDLTFKAAHEAAALLSGSPFPDWKTARRFAGPMPFTFSAADDHTMIVIEGSRQDWVPQPIEVERWAVSFFDETPLRGATPILANAFAVEGVPYRWHRGRIVRTEGAA
jgi:hypothetical protein